MLVKTLARGLREPRRASFLNTDSCAASTVASFMKFTLQNSRLGFANEVVDHFSVAGAVEGNKQLALRQQLLDIFDDSAVWNCSVHSVEGCSAYFGLDGIPKVGKGRRRLLQTMPRRCWRCRMTRHP